MDGQIQARLTVIQPAQTYRSHFGGSGEAHCHPTSSDCYCSHFGGSGEAHCHPTSSDCYCSHFGGSGEAHCHPTSSDLSQSFWWVRRGSLSSNQPRLIAVILVGQARLTVIQPAQTYRSHFGGSGEAHCHPTSPDLSQSFWWVRRGSLSSNQPRLIAVILVGQARLTVIQPAQTYRSHFGGSGEAHCHPTSPDLSQSFWWIRRGSLSSNQLRLLSQSFWWVRRGRPGVHSRSCVTQNRPNKLGSLVTNPTKSLVQ